MTESGQRAGTQQGSPGAQYRPCVVVIITIIIINEIYIELNMVDALVVFHPAVSCHFYQSIVSAAITSRSTLEI